MRFALLSAAVCLLVAAPAASSARGMLAVSAVRTLGFEGRGMLRAHQSAAYSDDNEPGRRDDERRGLDWLFASGIFAFKKTILVALVLLAGLIRRVVRKRSKVVPLPLPPLPPRS